jgi:hypothetical protein
LVSREIAAVKNDFQNAFWERLRIEAILGYHGVKILFDLNIMQY